MVMLWRRRTQSGRQKKKVNVHVAGGYQGHTTYTIGERSYRRKLGNAEACTDKTTLAGAPQIRTSPVGEKRKPSSAVQIDSAVRIAEMDIEGIDVNYMAIQCSRNFAILQYY